MIPWEEKGKLHTLCAIGVLFLLANQTFDTFITLNKSKENFFCHSHPVYYHGKVDARYAMHVYRYDCIGVELILNTIL